MFAYKPKFITCFTLDGHLALLVRRMMTADWKIHIWTFFIYSVPGHLQTSAIFKVILWYQRHKVKKSDTSSLSKKLSNPEPVKILKSRHFYAKIMDESGMAPVCRGMKCGVIRGIIGDSIPPTTTSYGWILQYQKFNIELCNIDPINSYRNHLYRKRQY